MGISQQVLMDPKSDSSKKLTSKKNTQKKPTPRSTLHFRNKDTDKSSCDLEKYPNMGQVEPRKKKPKGMKETTVDDTPLVLHKE